MDHVQQQERVARDWIGHDVVDGSGSKVGKIGSMYINDSSGRLEWIAIETGWFSRKLSLAPLQGAIAEGDHMRLPHSSDTIKGAPQVAPDGQIDPAKQDELYRYYRGAPSASSQSASTDDATTRSASSDDAMTRSEEELQAEKRVHESGRARLRKYLVTEEVTLRVPVQHEEVRVVKEPITEENRAAAMSGEDLAEREHEVVLHEEEVVPHKQVVPKERVRLETEKVVEDRQISEPLQKEKIELEGAARTSEGRAGGSHAAAPETSRR